MSRPSCGDCIDGWTGVPKCNLARSWAGSVPASETAIKANLLVKLGSGLVTVHSAIAAEMNGGILANVGQYCLPVVV